MKTEVYFNLHPINFLIASGVLQVFVLSALLFFHKNGNQLSNRILAFLLLAVNLHLTYLLLLDLNLDNLFPQLLWFPYSFLTGIGPLLFFYTKSLIESDFRISKQEMLLFIPLGLEVGIQGFQIGWSVVFDEMYYNVQTAKITTPLIYIAAVISIQYYLRKSIKEIDVHEKELTQQFSEIMKKTLQWLTRLLSYYRLFWLFWIPFAVVFMVLFRAQVQNLFTISAAYFLLIFLTYLTYWIGLQGLLKGTTMNVGALMKRTKKGSYSHLSEGEIIALMESIKTEVEENECYLNPTLSLREFASVLDKDPNLVSYVINQHLKKTFYELVNFHRIEAVKSRMAQNDTVRFTLLAIAMECGFNSKTSFNRVFKEMTGMTPSQYLSKLP